MKRLLPNLPIAEKLVLYFLFLGVMVIALIAPFTYFSSRKALLDRTFNQLTSVRVMRTQQLEAFFADRGREAELLARSPGIQEIFRYLQEPDNHSIESYQSLMSPEIIPNREYVSRILFAAMGNVTYCYDRESGDTLYTIPAVAHPPLPNGYGSVYQDYFNLGAGDPYLLVWARVDSLRSLALAVPSGSIDRILLENDPLSGLGYSGECYLVGNDSLMRSTSRFHQPSILRTMVRTPAVRAAFASGQGSSIIPDYRNVMVLSSYNRVQTPGLDWVILAEIDLKETMQPVWQLRNSIIILSVLISLVMFILAFISARWITRPMRSLKEAASRIGEGHLEARVSMDGNDEISQLAESFNAMAIKLDTQQVELAKERTRQYELTLDGQETERKRLSRELHDGLGQTLIALKLKLEQVDPKNTCDAFATIKSVKGTLDDIVDDIRRISNDLMPGSLEAFGLGPALRKLCHEIQENGKIRINLMGENIASKPGSRISIYIYRIIQEALNNIIRHSRASLAWISFIELHEMLRIEIRDNGIGMPNADKAIGSGQGLFNMRERVKILGGEMRLHSMLNEGTTILIDIPWK